MEEWPTLKYSKGTQWSGLRSWNWILLPKKSWTAPKVSRTSVPNSNPKEAQGTADIQTKRSSRQWEKQTYSFFTQKLATIAKSKMLLFRNWMNQRSHITGRMLQSWHGVSELTNQDVSLSGHDRLQALSRAACSSLSSAISAFAGWLKKPQRDAQLQKTVLHMFNFGKEVNDVGGDAVLGP